MNLLEEYFYYSYTEKAMGMKEAGKYLQQRRKENTSLSQDEIAEAVGLKSNKAISDWENGRYALNAETAARYFDLVGADPAVFHLLLTGKAQTELEALEQLIAQHPERYARSAEQIMVDIEEWHKRDRRGFTAYFRGWIQRLVR